MMDNIKYYKIILRLAVLIVVLPLLIYAQDKTEFFQQGNQLYRAGEYEKALNSYIEIYKSGYESGPLYYNIGNCYYKLDETGRAILYYERAKKLIPGDEELEFNLKLAHLSVVDKIEPLPTFFLFKAIDGFIYLIPTSILIWIVAALYLLFITFLIFRILSRNRYLRRMCSRVSIMFLVFFIIFGFSLFTQITEKSQQEEAVIMAEEVNVKGAPSEGATTLFTLHEGTKVHIEKVSGDWFEVLLADGKVGWVKQDILERI